MQQMGFALGAALSGLAANTAGFAVGLPHEAMAHVAFVVPVCFAVSAAIGCVVALRLNAFRAGVLRRESHFRTASGTLAVRKTWARATPVALVKVERNWSCALL